MDGGEISAVAGYVTGQQGITGSLGMGSNVEVGKGRGACATKLSVFLVGACSQDGSFEWKRIADIEWWA